MGGSLFWGVGQVSVQGGLCGQTDACEKNTLPQTTFAGGKNKEPAKCISIGKCQGSMIVILF